MAGSGELLQALAGRAVAPFDELRVLAAEILVAAGMRREPADTAASLLASAQLRGIDSHGLSHLPAYVGRLLDGAIDPDAQMQIERPGTCAAVIDARTGLGVLAARVAIEEACDLASRHGMGACAVRNSNHFGAAALFAEMAAERGLIALAFSNAAPTMAPWGGKDAVLGTNPLAAAFPRPGKKPIVVDMATSAVARARIRRSATAGEAIPLDWALDQSGAPTSDAQAAMNGTVQPLGGAKGYALALVIELLSAALSGGRPGFTVRSPHEPGPATAGTSHLFVALDPAKFAGTDVAASMIETVALKIETSDAGVAGRPRLPGARAARELERRAREGIPLSAGLLGSLRDAQQQLVRAGRAT